MKKIALFLTFFMSVISISAQQSFDIKYNTKKETQHMFINMYIDNICIQDVVIDTGCDVTMLNYNCYLKLKKSNIISDKDKVGVTPVAGIGGNIKLNVYNIKCIKIGNYTLHNIYVIFNNNPNSRNLLGQNILNKFNGYYINNKNNSIRFYY